MSERESKETRELLEAGWEQRDAGPKAIWCGPGSGRWTSRYQALFELRNERLPGEGPIMPGGDE